MNEWFKKLFANIKEKWTKWSALQKGIAIGVVVVVVIAIIVLASVSSKDTSVKLYNRTIDESEISDIENYLDTENVWYEERDGYICVKDKATANKYRSVLIKEGIAPKELNVYDKFGENKWARTDFDNKALWKDSCEKSVKRHLKSIDGIRDADVIINFPEESIFAEDQNAVTCSVVLKPYAGTDILTDKKQIKGIQNLILASVEGLKEKDLVISDESGMQINDFEGMADFDRTANIDKQQSNISKYEKELSKKVYDTLYSTYKDRVGVPAVTLEMDFSERTTTSTEYSGITIKKDNPDTSYDDSEVVQSIPLSFEKGDKTYTSRGLTPEGVSGVEGQNPPVYTEESTLEGKSTESVLKQNNAINQKNIEEKYNPDKGRRTCTVNIDVKRARKIDEKTGRYAVDENGTNFVWVETYMTPEELANVTSSVENAIGYDRNRGDKVTVTNLPVDHTADDQILFEREQKKSQRSKIIVWSLIGIAVILVAFVLFRVVSKQLERKKRLHEEELLRKQQTEREQALWDAKNEGMEVTMSVEERKRTELAENAVALSKEHPEDVAMLLRTWIMEE